MSTLKMFLLGAPRLECGGKPVKLPRQKSLALLIYLAANQREHARETLATLLWPDANDTQSRQALRTALSDIRRAAGDKLLIADTETISLNPPSNFWMDVNELEALARDDARECPPNLRIGPFLQGFNLKDAPDFDDWVAFERDRLTQLATKMLRTRAEISQARGDWTEAITWARQLLTLDNVHEETHRQLMRLYSAMGDRAAAIQQYETARTLLERELGVEPMEETRALYQQILDPVQTSTPIPAQGPRRSEGVETLLPFVGRESERAELQRGWEMARNGAMRFLFVEGEAGVGKTRLVGETLAQWDSQALILRGTGHPSENNQPYHPFLDLLREYFDNVSAMPLPIPDVWLGEIGRLIPELCQARRDRPLALRLPAAPDPGGLIEAAQERSRLFEAISQFLLTLAGRQPLVLFIDDVQWADPSTLALLAYLSTSLALARVLVLCAYRSAETSADLENLIRSLSRAGTLMRVPLPRLQPHQVSELAKSLSQRDSAPFAEWLYRESEGNPFFIREMVAYLIANGLVQANEYGWQTDLNQLASTLPAAVPSSIHDLMRARLQGVSELARQLLQVAAIIGRDFDFPTLWRASGRDEDHTLDALDELLHAQLVRQTATIPNPYEFTHTKIREVVLLDMSLARQQILHRRAGEALELSLHGSMPDVLGRLALHFGAATEWAKAARFASAAGDHARAVFAPQEAIQFYKSALESFSHLDDREATARVHLGLGEAYAALGRQDHAITSYAQALRTWEQLDERERVAAVRFAMGLSHLFRTEFRRAYELAQAGLRDLQDLEQPDVRVIAQGHALWGTALSMEGRALEDARTHLRQAIDLYEQTDDYAGRCRVQIEMGNIAAQEGQLEQAVAYYEQALENARLGQHPLFEAMAGNNAAYHSLLLGDVAKANQLLQSGLALATMYDIAPMLVCLYSTAGEIRLSEKKWTDAEALFQKGMALAEQLNSPERRAGYLANLAEVADGRGEPALAIAQLTAATQLVDDLGVRHASARYHLRLAEMLSRQGQRAEALAHLQRGQQIAQEEKYAILLEEAERIKRT